MGSISHTLVFDFCIRGPERKRALIGVESLSACKGRKGLSPTRSITFVELLKMPRGNPTGILGDWSTLCFLYPCSELNELALEQRVTDRRNFFSQPWLTYVKCSHQLGCAKFDLKVTDNDPSKVGLGFQLRSS